MSIKDFNVKRLRTSRIIGSGSATGGSPHTLIYSASKASNFDGGLVGGGAMLSEVGLDVGLFVSGTTGARAAWRAGTATTQGGTTLFGGDLHVSGNITTDGAPIGGGGLTSGSFNVPSPSAFVTTASISFAGSEGFTYRAKSGGPSGGTGTGTDVFFFVSGSRTRSGSNDRSDVNSPAVAMFGGDVVVSGTLYAERQVIEVDERVDGAFFVSGAMQVSQSATVHNYLDVLGNTGVGTKYGARLNSTYPTGNWRLENSAVSTTALWSEAAAGSSHVMGIDLLGIRYLTITGSNSLPTLRKAVFNENSLDIDFRVHSDTKSGAILVDAGTDQVILGTEGTAASNAGGNSTAVGSDVSVYLSGTIGGAATPIGNGDLRSTVVSAGDLVVSGTTHTNTVQSVNGNLNIKAIDTDDSDIIFTVDDGGSNVIALTIDGSEQASSTFTPVDGGYLSVNDSGNDGFSNIYGDATAVFNKSSNTNAGELQLIRSRGADVSRTAVQTGDSLGTLKWTGYEGANNAEGASISAEIDGTVAIARLPTNLVFNTRNGLDGSSATQLKLRGPGLHPVAEITGSVEATLGLSGSLTQLVDGTSYLREGPNITITSASNGSITIASTGGGGTSDTLGWTGPASGQIATTGSLQVDGNVTLGNAPADNIELNGTIGTHILPGADSTYNLGSATFRWANIYTGDLHLRNEKGNWTIQEEADDLIVINNRTGRKYKMMLAPLEDSE